MYLFYSKSIFSFRKYGKLDDNVFDSFEFAWPVEAWECYANKIEPSSLDALSFTILDLLNRKLSPNKIAEYLGISGDLIKIVQDTLAGKNYYDIKQKAVSEEGLNYLSNAEGKVVSSEKVFGYMFQSMIDGEFFPFFHEGTLPDPYYDSSDNGQFLDFKGRQASYKDNMLQEKISRAYHKHCAIYDYEQNRQDSCIPGYYAEDDELLDLPYDAPENTEEYEKSAFSFSNDDTDLQNARIRLLKTPSKTLFIKCRAYILKDEPERFFVEPPFDNNETRWYSDAFSRMGKNDQVLFGRLEDREKKTLKEYCSQITKQMFIELPELKNLNPQEYISRTYPEINKCSLKNELVEHYKKIIRQEALAQNEYIVLESARTIEFILNKYIARTGKTYAAQKYFKCISNSSDIESVSKYLGISDCSAVRTEIRNWNNNTDSFKHFSILRNFNEEHNGRSILEKYYYLMVYAYQNSGSKIAGLFKENKDLVEHLDHINSMRNTKSAAHDHEGGEKIDIEKFKEHFKKASRILVTNFDYN